MTESVTISKDPSSFPDYLDFQKLRAKGLEHIQELGTDLWTDYNLHDPGVTILEVLCYALTDLGYRTNFDTRDLLTRSPSAKAEDKARATKDGKLYDDNFYTPEQILTCNPVTLLDLRKLLIDIPGVRNAWLERATEAEVALYINEKKNELQYTLPDFVDLTDEAAIDEATLSLKGLYTVCLDVDSEGQRDCGRPYTSLGDILEAVCAVLHRHRNLCEDFLDVVVLADEEIGICADVELTPEADPEEVLLGIYKTVQAFLSPTFQFYSLQEMLEKGKRIEEIFEGRPLSPQSHGFIDVDDLKKADLREMLHASDLYQEIMDVKGVLAIRKLVFSNYVNDLPQTLGEKWCLKLTPKHRPVLDLDKSTFTFYKGLLPFTANKKDVLRRYEEEKAASTKALLEANQLDFPVPDGAYRELQDYYSIQNDFPQVYGIGEVGLRLSETPERKAQARQLKAYLLFYDQILANYLAQLANVRELFSMRPDEEAHRIDNKKNRTYFTQLLSEVPRVDDLLRNIKSCGGDEGYLDVPEDYPEYLDYIAESLETYHDRRNRFLDHLLGRFAESFTDYVLLMYNINGKRNDNDRIIQDKTDFLSSYPEISRDRGKAFNYKEKPAWDTENVSGLQKRVSKLVGIDDVSRRHLSHCDIVAIEKGWHFILTVPGEGDDDPLVLTSKQRFATQEEAQGAYDAFILLARHEANYQRLAYEGDTVQYGFVIVDGGSVCVVEGPSRFETTEARDIRLFSVINYTNGSGMACEVVQATECYFYELYDADGTALLFVAETGDSTAADAQAAYKNEFLPAAKDASFYRDIDEVSVFGFDLMTEPGGDERLARHPFVYETAQERDDRKQAIIYYLDDVPPRFGTDGPLGHFDLEVRDNAGTLLFVHPTPYLTEAAALEAYREIVRQARFRVHYRQRDDLEGAAPFGFELLDRSDTLIAVHPTAYETDIARDLALDAIIHLLCEDDDIRFEVEESEGVFTFELQDLDGAPLFIGSDTFATEAEALDAFQAFLTLAADNARYVLLDNSPDVAPFGFELTDATDATIAAHPVTYAQEAERDLAVQSIINYVSPAELEFEITGEVGILHVVLLGEADRVLFKSIATYPDEEATREAFDDLILLARDQEHYHLLPGFGFDLRDDEDQIVAEHPQTYTSDDERDAAIDLILAYVREDAVVFDVVNTQGAYFFDVQDEDGTSWLIGTQTHPGLPEAAAACTDAFGRADDEANYRRFDAGPGTCPFGFELLDETDTVVARHPRGYTSEAARDAALQYLIYTVLEGSSIPDVVQPRNGAFGFVLVDLAGETLFASEQTWVTAAEAEDAFRNEFVPLAENIARYALGYDNDLCLYTFFLEDGAGKVVATHPNAYTSRRERDEAVEAILYFVAPQDLTCVLHGTDCGYYFQLSGEEGTPGEGFVFVSSERFPEPAHASSACNQVLPLLADEAHYAIVDDGGGGWYLVVRDAEGIEQAVYQGLEDTQEDLQNIIAAIRTYVTQERALDHEFIEEGGGFWYRLVGPEDEVLFTSTRLYATEDQAWNATNAFCERVQEDAPYRLITDPVHCLYGFELTNKAGETEAEHHGFYPTSDERNDAIAAIQAWVDDEGLHLIEHLLLRPKHPGGEPSFFYELFHEETEVSLLRSVAVYADEAAAIQALRHLLVRILSDTPGLFQVYSQTAKGQRCYRFRLIDGSVHLADHNGAYGSEEDAEAAVNALVAYVWSLVEDEDLFGPDDDLETILDIIAQVQLGDDFLETYVGRLAPEQDLVPDGFLPLDEGCLDDKGTICSLKSDPYSFRATVVLPYWPKRFRNVSFRHFFERTIRTETPAHIFLRICWVDVCDMRDFEDAYRTWLRSQVSCGGGCADPEGDCESTEALNRLIDLVVRLRNVYPEAILRGCEDSSDGPPIILNQTLLGSATVESDDNG